MCGHALKDAVVGGAQFAVGGWELGDLIILKDSATKWSEFFDLQIDFHFENNF